MILTATVSRCEVSKKIKKNHIRFDSVNGGIAHFLWLIKLQIYVLDFVGE